MLTLSRQTTVRTLTVLAIAIWLGGLTFYAAVVIPIGSDVVGGHRAFGFVTRRVTVWLNGIGTTMTVILLAQLWLTRGAARPRTRCITWLGIAVAQIALIVMHPWLDALLDADARSILDADDFYGRHRAYLLVTTAQWLATVVHLWAWMDATFAPSNRATEPPMTRGVPLKVR